ncbi:MAG: hypothetical protein GX772_00155 [Alcaligenaceae bacterium]|nr:hypothetical protein [Alcaligenaceae bacterium]
MKAVIDTNVLLVANRQHADISEECAQSCVDRLQAMQAHGITVIDDAYHILGEYQHKTSISPPKGVGDVFLKWLLRNAGNPMHVEMVSITETEPEHFAEFPCDDLQQRFDAPDRKFPATAHAHPEKPPIWQAADCKWLDWWPTLAEYGVQVEFLCPADARGFYRNKFPKQPIPAAPAATPLPAFDHD